jgi:hypothetical protein
MSDFEKMVNTLRNEETSCYAEGKHFEVWEWESGGKQIEFRPVSYCDEWITFEYDNDGNLLRVF